MRDVIVIWLYLFTGLGVLASVEERKGDLDATSRTMTVIMWPLPVASKMYSKLSEPTHAGVKVGVE